MLSLLLELSPPLAWSRSSTRALECCRTGGGAASLKVEVESTDGALDGCVDGNWLLLASEGLFLRITARGM